MSTNDPSTPDTIVLINGLWMTALQLGALGETVQ